MRRGFLCFVAVLLLLGPSPSRAQKSVEQQLAAYSKNFSDPSKSLEATLRMAQLFERMGATEASTTQYLALLKDERTPSSPWLDEILDGWERILREEVNSPPRRLTLLRAWVDRETPIYASASSRRKSGRAVSSSLHAVLSVSNGRVLIPISNPDPAAENAWVRLKDIELRLEDAGRDPLKDLRLFKRYLDAPLVGDEAVAKRLRDCCLEEIGRRYDDLVFVGYSKRAYIDEFPNGRHIEEAKASLEKDIFLEAKNGGKIADYQYYLQEYPNGRYADQARTAIESLVFGAAERSNRIDMYHRYLRQYPEGEFADAAHGAIEKIQILDSCRSGNSEDCRAFLRNYPQSEHRPSVERQIEDLANEADAAAYARAIGSDSEAGYLGYLSEHPSGTKAPEARQALERLRLARTGNPTEIIRFVRNAGHSLQREHASALARKVLDSPLAKDDLDALLFVYENLEQPSPGETQQLQARLVSLALQKNDCSNMIQLYDVRQDPIFLAAAIKHLEPTKEEEYEIARRFPTLLLGLAGLEDIDPRQVNGATFMFANDVVSLKPYYKWTLTSRARHAHLRFRVRMVMPVNFHRYYNGIAWFDPGNVDKHWTEKLVAETVVSIPPLSSRSAEFNFPRFKAQTGTGMANVYSVQTRSEPGGVPEFKFSDIKLVN